MGNDLNFYPLSKEEITMLIDCFDNYKYKLAQDLDEDDAEQLEIIIEKAKLELNYYDFDDEDINMDY